MNTTIQPCPVCGYTPAEAQANLKSYFPKGTTLTVAETMRRHAWCHANVEAVDGRDALTNLIAAINRTAHGCRNGASCADWKRKRESDETGQG